MRFFITVMGSVPRQEETSGPLPEPLFVDGLFQHQMLAATHHASRSLKASPFFYANIEACLAKCNFSLPYICLERKPALGVYCGRAVLPLSQEGNRVSMLLEEQLFFFRGGMGWELTFILK